MDAKTKGQSLKPGDGVVGSTLKSAWRAPVITRIDIKRTREFRGYDNDDPLRSL